MAGKAEFMSDPKPGTVIAQIVVTAEAEVIKATDIAATEPDEEEQP